MMWGQLLTAAMALSVLGCSYGPVEDRSRFEAAVLLPDQRTAAVVYRVSRYRPATGMAAFPDGGIPLYVADRRVIATVDIAGGRPHILQRIQNRGVPGSGSLTVRVEAADPGHLLAVESVQPSTSETDRTRYWRLRLRDGRVLPYPDLKADLRQRGLELGASEFGDIRVIDPDGTLLIGATGPGGGELWLREAGGRYRRVDPITHFYGVLGTELYYWSGDEAVVRDWRTQAKRVIARYDPQIRQTSRLIARDPTVAALEATSNGPDIWLSLGVDGQQVTRMSRRGAPSPIAIDMARLRD
jgi:hypothetical protein